VNLFEFSERVFFETIYSTLRQTGEIGDVFPEMVAYNVPLYALRLFWPDERRALLQSGKFPAFCIAEKDWRGRIENIQAMIQESNGSKELVFQKTYVMNCDVMYVVARTNSGLAICRVPKKADQTWQSRGEESVRFLSSSTDRVVDHFVVSGKVTMDPESWISLTKREYTVAGINIPRREMTGIAVLSVALLEHHGVGVDSALPLVEKLLLARESGDLRKEDVLIAREIFSFFQLHSKTISIHPFWSRAAQMFA